MRTTVASETPKSYLPIVESAPRIARALRTGLFLFSVLIALLVAEVGLRALGVKPIEATKGDALLGLVPTPNNTQMFNFPEYGRGLIKKTNSLGFHENQNTGPKEPGTRRIGFVGDSQTEGICPNDYSFPHLMADLMNQEGTAGRRVEAINAGVGRYSPYQYFLRAQRDVLPLKPDDLVVVIYLGNDLTDLLRRDDRPFLTVESSGQVSAHKPVWVALQDPSRRASWLEQSRVYSLIWSVLGPTLNYQISRAHMLLVSARPNGHNTFEILRYMWDVYRLSGISVNMMTQCLHQEIWFDHFPDSVEEALRINRNVMEQFKTICDHAGIRLHYVFLPSKATIEPQDMAAVLDKVHVYNAGITARGIATFEEAITARMAADCAALQIHALDLRGSLKVQGSGRRLYYPEDLHLNVTGNRIVARELSKFLGEK